MTNRLEEQLLTILQDIRRRAHEAQRPLECVEATLAIEELAAGAIRDIRAGRVSSPLDAADRLTPDWMSRIREFDALEIHPCRIVATTETGEDIVETGERKDADFWTVYGHCRSGGIEAFEDFPTEAEAIRFRDRLSAAYPHLAS